MYLSFITDEKEKLAERLDKLEEFESDFVGRCEAIVDNIRDQMFTDLNDMIHEMLEEHELDNAFNEHAEEMKDTGSDYIKEELYAQ